ncbi:hypothetical protein VWM73_11025, partial [Campylobacter coli]
KAVIYFEVVSTLALAIGIFMANIMQPGHGMNLDPKQLDTTSVLADTHRQSGLLIPKIVLKNSEGLYYEQPIYIAPYENWDLELNP